MVEMRTVYIDPELGKELWKTFKNRNSVKGRAANAPGRPRAIIAANIAATLRKPAWTTTAAAATPSVWADEQRSRLAKTNIGLPMRPYVPRYTNPRGSKVYHFIIRYFALNNGTSRPRGEYPL